MGNNVTLPISKDEWDSFRRQQSKQAVDISDMCLILKGKPEARIIGVVDKVENNEENLKELKEAVEDIVEARKQERAIMIGIGIGIGLNFVTGAATLASIVKVLSALTAVGVP